jgi:hypothetical protein
MLCIYKLQRTDKSISFVWELVKDCPQEPEKAWVIAEALTEETGIEHMVGRV